MSVHTTENATTTIHFGINQVSVEFPEWYILGVLAGLNNMAQRTHISNKKIPMIKYLRLATQKSNKNTQTYESALSLRDAKAIVEEILKNHINV